MDELSIVMKALDYDILFLSMGPALLMSDMETLSNLYYFSPRSYCDILFILIAFSPNDLCLKSFEIVAILLCITLLKLRSFYTFFE
jgi:hypothetical protein